jgi:hypothetical protein
MVTTAKLGIDFGGIIVPAATAEDSSLFGKDCEDNGITPRCGTVEALKKLVPAFDGNVWIVSRASPPTARCTRRWLAHHDFWRQTGMLPTHLVFCWDRPDKITVCKALGITHYIDDRLPVLEALKEDVKYLYFMPDEIEEQPGNPVAYVECWDDAVTAILASLQA